MPYQSRTLGALGSRLLSHFAAANKTVFSITEAKAGLTDKSDAAVAQLLSRLVKTGWLIRLKRGRYLIVPLEAESPDAWSEDSFIIAAESTPPNPYSAAGAAASGEYAISHWSALNYYGYSSQVPRSIFVSTPHRRTSTTREILDVPHRMVFVSPEKFFGITTIRLDNKLVRITDKEKTIVDCLDRPRLCGGIVEAAEALSQAVKEGIDLDRLSSYADRLGNRTVLKRLGFLAETLELPVGAHLEAWRGRISGGYSLLDPTRPKRGRYDGRWRLVLNVSEDDLSGSTP